MNTVCIGTRNAYPEKIRGQSRAYPPVQQVGGNAPLSTNGSTPMDKAVVYAA